MIRFEEGNNCFNYRVAGIAVHENSVLLHRGLADNFWTFPGGRAEFGEPAEQTLKREMKEEIGAEIEVVRLLWFVENFFTYDGFRYHEIGLFFLMKLPATSRYHDHSGPMPCDEEGSNLIFQWFPLKPDVLASLPLLPSFLQTRLHVLPESVQHVIQYDE